MFKGPLIPCEEILIRVEGLYILIKLVRRSKAGRRRCRKPGSEIFIDSLPGDFACDEPLG